MHIEKLPSGSYRITQTDNGKRYRITIDHKPSKAEATRLIAERITKSPTSTPNLTLSSACDAYIADRENIISPSTALGYSNLVRKIPQKYASLHLMQITNSTVQAIANKYAADHSAKSTKNYVSFIVSVLKYYDVDVKYPSLPQKEKKTPYIPSKEDVMAVLAEIKGTDYEIPITLAAMGLRRSEICALTLDDLQGNKLTINKAMVQNKDKEWVIKTTKTQASIRTITIPKDLAKLIQKQGYVYKGFPGNILKNLRSAQDRAGVPHFQLHKLRHFFASYMHDQGFTDKQIQETGGWGDGSRIMKLVYQHAMDMEKAQQRMADSIGDLMTQPERKPTKKPTKR